jgi:hypothetical protein
VIKTGISPKTKELLKKIFCGDIMVYSMFVWLYSMVQGMRVIMIFDDWMNPVLWQSLLKDVIIGDAFIILSGLLGNVIGNMKKDKEILKHNEILKRERQRDRTVRRQARTINAAYLKLQVACLQSDDDTVRMAARLEADNMVNAGVSLFDFIDKLEAIEDEMAPEPDAALADRMEGVELDDRIDGLAHGPPVDIEPDNAGGDTT